MNQLPVLFVGTKYQYQRYTNGLIIVRRLYAGLRISETLGIDSLYMEKRRETLTLTTDVPVLLSTGKIMSDNKYEWSGEFSSAIMGRGVANVLGSERGKAIIDASEKAWHDGRQAIVNLRKKFSVEISAEKLHTEIGVIDLLVRCSQEAHEKDAEKRQSAINKNGTLILDALSEEKTILQQILLQDSFNDLYQCNPQIPFWSADQMLDIVYRGNCDTADQKH